MKVVTAKTAGFCFGVQRAVDKVYELISSECGPIYTYGPIIHNEMGVRGRPGGKRSPGLNPGRRAGDDSGRNGCYPSPWCGKTCI